MQDKMFTAFNEQTRGFFEPMRKLNSLMLNNMEKMTQYQLESMKRYSQLGTERLRDASEIKDAEDIREFGTRQAEIMSELSNQMLEDARAMTELSMQFKSEMEQLFGEAAEKAAAQAEEATKATTTPAKASSQASKKSS
ncbi:phasin family protein [Halomonas sp. ML-15]|uniref:phasin family protein n=1 Tax=Halomonas sp. ML-15 TaxID=2773305 RepID=UPI001747502B|nr:phasin family protein [Halomonas sp. ML-15]MBD3897137.1 phasin family protein [Halomonas sp. ML-15]